MKLDPQKLHRRSIRLQGYDYTQPGAYFITICTWQRECLFGDINGGEMSLNRLGEVVLHAWQDLPHHYSHLELGGFCVMPNHVHAIMVLVEDDPGRGGSVSSGVSSPSLATYDDLRLPDQAKTRPRAAPALTEGRGIASNSDVGYTPIRHGLPEIVRAFKSFSARRLNLLRHTLGIPVWQRNYYEHIIRDDCEHDRIRSYIESNPLNWNIDDEHPEKRS